jgi:hypothetical protein
METGPGRRDPRQPAQGSADKGMSHLCLPKSRSGNRPYPRPGGRGRHRHLLERRRSSPDRRSIRPLRSLLLPARARTPAPRRPTPPLRPTGEEGKGSPKPKEILHHGLRCHRADLSQPSHRTVKPHRGWGALPAHPVGTDCEAGLGRTHQTSSTRLQIRRAHSSKAGLPPRTPRRVGCGPRCFNPHCLRGTRQDLPCTSAGEPRTPVGSPVRAPHWSSAEVFSWQQRGGREGERPRRCRPSADSIRAGVRSKAHRFVVAGRAGCTGSRSVAVTAGHQGDEHVPRALLVPRRGEDHGH